MTKKLKIILLLFAISLAGTGIFYSFVNWKETKTKISSMDQPAFDNGPKINSKWLASGGIESIMAKLPDKEIAPKEFNTSAEEIAAREPGEEIISLRTANKQVLKGSKPNELQAKIYFGDKYYLDETDSTYKEINTSIHEISDLAKSDPARQFDEYIDAGVYKATWFKDKPWNYKLYVGDSWIQYEALFDKSAVLDIEVEITKTGIKENITLKDNTAPTTLSWQVAQSGSGITTPPPTAKDANGKNVPIASNQIGNILTYQVDTTGAVFPIIVDPSSRTSTNAGYISGMEYNNYTAARDAITGFGLSQNQFSTGQIYTSNLYMYAYRSFISFAIPDMTTITAASLFGSGTASDNHSDTDFDIYLHTSTYSNPIVKEDLDLFDGHQASGAYNGTVLNNTWNSSSYTADYNNEIVFNAAGLSAIFAKKNDTFKLVAISKEDYNNSAPTGQEYVNFSATYLSITYSPTFVPTVTTQAVTLVHSAIARGNGNVTNDGGENITERGVVVGTSENPTTANDKFTTTGMIGAYFVGITGRTAGTLYHVRAYATNSLGTSYGDDVTFTADPASPTATNNGSLWSNQATFTLSRDAITATSAASPLSVGLFSHYTSRSFFSFSIPNLTGCTLNAVSLFLYGAGDQSTTDFEVYLLTSTYSNPIVKEDFDLFDGHQASGAYNGTVLNNTWNSSSYSATWNQIDFNAAGLSAILAKSNSTFLMAAISKEDYDNSAPTLDEYIYFYSSSTAGKEPYLLITYTLAADGIVCTADEECENSNCELGPNTTTKYCAAASKECGQSGGAGYDTGEEVSNDKCQSNGTWLCNAGYYNPSGSCTATTAGYYSVEDSDSQTACPAGVYGTGGSTSSACFGNCTAGYYGSSTGQTAATCDGQCTAGYYCSVGSTSATQNECGTGKYCPTGSSGTTNCDAGYYGSSTTNSVSTCNGACTAGYYCSAGSTSATQNNCGSGNYCVAASGSATACPAGTYGSTANLQTSACTGQCTAGYYGSSTGQTTSACTGQCTAGYYCSAGSTSATQNECGTGKYCPTGSSGTTNCDAGYYGSSTTNSVSTCDGACTAGYYCSAGSTSATQNECGGNQYYCPAASESQTSVSSGYYSTGGTATTRTGQSQCAAGTYCADGIQSNCPAGTYGSTVGLATSACTGNCTAGYYCSAGSTSATQNECGTGKYCSTGSSNTTNCDAGYYGSSTTNSISTCDGQCTAGYYCTAGSTSATQNNCGTGNYCPSASSGTTACPAGTYGSTANLTTFACSGNCTAGYYCSAGSTSATQNECGGNQYYCPAASESQTSVSSGYYSTGGTATARTGQSQCAAGTYCADGIQSNCPAGTYGSTAGLTTSACSGNCACCPAGSTSVAQNVCGGGLSVNSPPPPTTYQTYDPTTGKTTIGEAPAQPMPAIVPPVVPVVPGATTDSEGNISLEQMQNDASVITIGDVNQLVSEIGVIRDIISEANYSQTIVEKIMKDSGVTAEVRNTINNFVTYGTMATQELGVGERAGVVNSFKSAFGKLPTTKEDWNDVIKIANGRWPSQTSKTAEDLAAINFRKVYLRSPDRTDPLDDAAIAVMAYGLRPSTRNLESEKAAIETFKAIYDYTPSTATDWDVVRAIAYSGLNIISPKITIFDVPNSDPRKLLCWLQSSRGVKMKNVLKSSVPWLQT